MEWRDLNAPDGYCGFFPDDGEAQLPVTECTSVMVVGEMAAPICLQQDSWDASVSVADIGTIETAEGIPVVYGGNYDEADYKDPRNEFETVDGMPVYYGGDLNDSDCEDPVILLTKLGWIGVILTLRIGIVGCSRVTGRPSCL